MHGAQIALRSQIRFRQILCQDNGVILVDCLCAQQMRFGEQLNADSTGKGEKQDRYDHFH